MRTNSDIENLLAELDHCVADDLEGQDLEIKRWGSGSRENAMKESVHTAVGTTNGGAGTVVF